MKRKHNGYTVIGVAALMVAGMAASAAPATAATGWDRCPADKMCVFAGPNGTGAIAWFDIGDENLADGVGPTGMNNTIESVWNRNSLSYYVWTEPGLSGNGRFIEQKSRVTFTGAFENTISSLKKNRYNP